eukprot:CAMPEP_0119104120 /NCGR_PEP_ID=MMETSP1180-20130426/2416_1 /TAXON_ID=3052 ORGANISM="Chlamydomonas cf sp, Strain CCMP681" /NCGR_SAMPLE_ID=MMETSP1180 /ASSEMBLY_ACC=CAM_ASM_000741 /LENGTH=217 /DNA_ID=CAMNT_0007088797 /DNA_START=136 /DNA_END=789 /DNA_ORIENTATION=-
MLQVRNLTCRATGGRGPVLCHAGKVNARGKVSSRPGPASRKDSKMRKYEENAMLQELNQEQEPKQAEQPASSPSAPAATPTPTPSIPAPVAPPAPMASRSATEPSSGRSQPAPRMETPQVVVDRIFSRMVGCAAAPMILGVGLLVIIYFLKKEGGDDFPLWPAYLSQSFTLLGGLLGITYGAVSASWDPSQEGSLFGWAEFRTNLPVLLGNKAESQR